MYDVIVVGGGPTGMTTAGDLARAGRSVAVLEKHAQVNPSSRAFATMASTLEHLDARGLADDLLSNASRAQRVELFAGASLDLTHLRSRYRFAMITPQTNVDAALAGYAQRQGAEVHRDQEVVALQQDATGVQVTTADGTPWRATYVVAADGSRSTIRRLLGVEFPGKSVLDSVVLADVRLRNGPRDGGLTVASTRDAFGFLAPYGDGWFRSMTWDRDHQVADTAPVDDGEVERTLRATIGDHLDVAEISWNSRFHCDERQVANYRHGRVFLAGDAAHVHSPMGGQGMNTGIQDAANLAWKLAAVLDGAPEAVLDSYQAERHPIGKRVLRQSGLMLRAVTLHPNPARALRDAIAPRALRIPRIRDSIAGSFAGTELRYGRAVRVGEIPRDGRFALRGNVLVRPDGYVAWTGSDEGWREALRHWTGRSTLPTPVS